MPFLGTQRCSYDINFPLLITLFLELFLYLVVDCHLRWDILRRFDLRTRITVQSPHALNPRVPLFLLNSIWDQTI